VPVFFQNFQFICHLFGWGIKIVIFEIGEHKPYHWKPDEPTGIWFSCTLRQRAAPGRWFGAGLASFPQNRLAKNRISNKTYHV
jgi:hypothetical protein